MPWDRCIPPAYGVVTHALSRYTARTQVDPGVARGDVGVSPTRCRTQPARTPSLVYTARCREGTPSLTDLWHAVGTQIQQQPLPYRTSHSEGMSIYNGHSPEHAGQGPFPISTAQLSVSKLPFFKLTFREAAAAGHRQIQIWTTLSRGGVTPSTSSALSTSLLPPN